jgi:hypothetical protein
MRELGLLTRSPERMYEINEQKKNYHIDNTPLYGAI